MGRETGWPPKGTVAKPNGKMASSGPCSAAWMCLPDREGGREGKRKAELCLLPEN